MSIWHGVQAAVCKTIVYVICLQKDDEGNQNCEITPVCVKKFVSLNKKERFKQVMFKQVKI
jgi:hypothetical protein